MHDLYLALLFLGFVLTPCIVVLYPLGIVKTKVQCEAEIKEDEAEEYPLFI